VSTKSTTERPTGGVGRGQTWVVTIGFRDIFGDFSRDALPEGRHVELSTADDGAIVAADPEAMARALRNLLENAVKYSGDARHITVDVARRNGELAINVRDRGLGIPRENSARLDSRPARSGRSAPIS
jgi:K+-sensing histidine kinase KdpD